MRVPHDPCPMCRKMIPFRAAVCGYCHTDLDAYWASAKEAVREGERRFVAEGDLVMKNFPHRTALVTSAV